MRTLEIIVLWLLFATVSCVNHNGYVPQSEYDELMTEYTTLKESSEATMQQYVQEATAMDAILQELSGISGKTSALRSNLEQGTARLTQAEQIEGSLKAIKAKLATLEKVSAQNEGYKKLVVSLRKVIDDKEEEIQTLKKAIGERDRKISEQTETITRQSGTISSQSETISSQQEKLRLAVQEQAKLLYQAGVDFEELGDSSPSVSFRRNREKVKNLTIDMYEKSILYYSKAMETGYPEAEYRIASTKSKLAETENKK